MADSEEQRVSSTSTPVDEDELHHYEADQDSNPKQDLFTVDDIVDLVGGAQDALERHMAEDGEFVESSVPAVDEPATLLEPEPVTSSVPVATVPEPEPVQAAPAVEEPEPETPDSTTAAAVPEPPVVTPEAEPVSAQMESEPEVAPQPEPIRERETLPPAEPRKEAPAPAEAEERPVATEEAEEAAAAPASLVDLLYWRDVKTTGVVFGAALLLLLSLTVCSIVSVCSYIGLALLSVTICFRIYKGILQAIQKSDDGHPFKQFLDQEVALSEDSVHKYGDVVLAKLNKAICDLRRLFLVQDLVDSIKFAVLMWILTYVGGLFNGLTLLILTLIGAFSCPIVYEKHQAPIDHYVALINNHIQDVVGKIQAKVPGMKRKVE
ncbi:reticulon-3-like isoform X2 [Genypterus blacodes]|uniref:reticulon-3-like isoform X2 n=1 Tax=Genypterus blacodes TaxID=154954 RepID=UPI003F774A26